MPPGLEKDATLLNDASTVGGGMRTMQGNGIQDWRLIAYNNTRFKFCGNALTVVAA